MTSSESRATFRQPISFFRRHPVLLLLLLSPGIPEYLSSSSPLSAIVLNPPMFFFQIIANLGLYGSGVLIVREALVRWKKGWGTSLVLGSAYGILEEGIALSTLFDPNSSSRSLGGYGWWLGVNWVWSPTIAMFHALFSITLPILLFQLALPERNGKSLLERNSLLLTFGILCADVLSLMFIVKYLEHFSIGLARFSGSIIAISLLVVIGYKLPPNFISARSILPLKRPLVIALLGTAFFPIIIFGESLGRELNVPFLLLLPLILISEGVVLILLSRWIGHSNNRKHLVALASGALFPIAVFGAIAEISFPLVLLVDILLALFLLNLWRNSAGSKNDTLVQTQPL